MTATVRPDLHPGIGRDRYGGYLYAYPHKTAYRAFDPPLDLAQVWADEPATSRFLYVHVPFCEMRCGYCNLFTQSRPGEGVTDAWLAALGRQAAVWADAVGPGEVTRMVIGGGTPTILTPAQLEQLLDLVGTRFGADAHRAPTSIEVSPRTADRDRLAVLADRGVERISVGVESFDEHDLKALGRPQRNPVVHRALEAIRSFGFPILNLDLIYGASGQTRSSWRRSLTAALEWEPEELYLYPLYRRELTGLGRQPVPVDDNRPHLYDLALELLDARGYEQVSMRMFRRTDRSADRQSLTSTAATAATATAGVSGTVPGDQPVAYDCQDDGMIGLGCGARSYTRALHHSHDYAVSRSAVAGIIDDYLAMSDAAHGQVRHGFRLDDDEQRRRFVIKGILRRPGLDLDAYRRRFGSSALDDVALLGRFEDDGLLTVDDRWACPTAQGLAWSDALGSALVSPTVRATMRDCEIA